MCAVRYHLDCGQLKESWMKIFKDVDNVFWFCDECKQIVKSKVKELKCVQTMQQCSSELIKNTQKLVTLLQKKENKSSNDESSTVKNQLTYSDVMKQNKVPSIIIKPKEIQSSDKTKKELEQKINPTQLALAVKNVKQVSQGGVVVQCNDKDSLEKLQNKAVSELGQQYEIKVTKEVNPCILIVGVNEKCLDNMDSFIRRLRNQNRQFENIPEEEITVVRQYKPRNKAAHNVVLRIPFRLFEMVCGGKVFVGWDRCPVYEYIETLRCFKCWRYNHKAEHCNWPNRICPICSEAHEKTVACPVKKIECVNCKYVVNVLKVANVTYDHTVFDKKCFCYQKALEKIKSRTVYNK